MSAVLNLLDYIQPCIFSHLVHCLASSVVRTWVIHVSFLISSLQFTSVTQSCPTLCNPWTAARQASLYITNSQSLLKLMSIESVIPSNHLFLYCPLLLLPSIFPSIRVFSSESVLRIRWPKYSSFSYSISPSNETPRTDLL